MGRPKSSLTAEAEEFILENREEMPPRVLSKELKIPVSTIRNFLSEKGLCCTSEREFYKIGTKKVPDGCFNVNERANWMI